jgi:predicted amidohydrolase YtcJ
MTRDFTLRNGISPPPDRRESGLHDVVFRAGRLCGTRAAPAGGRARLFITPGFRDAHVHLLHLGMGRGRLDLSSSASLADALSSLAEFSKQRGKADVIWGVGWDETRWREQRPPVREEIDHWIPDQPVVMRRVCGHLAILNSCALSQAREHWSDISPSGRLVEEHAMKLASLWPDSPEEREEALLDAQKQAFRAGITRIAEMGSSGSAETYLSLFARGELRLHVDLFFGPAEMERAIELRDSGRFDRVNLRLGGIKIFADGSVGARTAAFLEPYADRQGRGSLLYPDHALYGLLERCLKNGLQVAIHAIGDAALRQVLRQMERLEAEHAQLRPGWVSLEHAELLTPGVLERIERLGVRLSVQPNFVAQWGHPGGLYDRALGQERWKRMNPFREIWQRDIAMVFGSDGMPMDPALGLHGAVHHPMPEFRLSPEEALAVYLGARGTPVGCWEPVDWWCEGCDGAVLYEKDPLLLVDGDIAAAPVVGVLWGGEWVIPPAEELWRSGVVHVD